MRPVSPPLTLARRVLPRLLLVLLAAFFLLPRLFREHAATSAPDRLFNTSSGQPIDRLAFPDIPFSTSFRRARDLLTRSSPSATAYHALVEEIQYKRNDTRECGRWQGRYADSHARQRAAFEKGDEKVRPVVYACMAEKWEFGESGGLADRMKGITSTFLMALLLDRPFFLYWSPTDPVSAEHGFAAPNVNWLWQWGEPDLSHGWMRRIYETNNSEGALYPTLAPEFEKATSLADYEAILDWRIAIVHTNAGAVATPLLSETWTGKRMRQMGFTLENVYGCLIHYLFRPIPQTMEQLALYQAVLSHPEVLSVALQIRIGDHAMEADGLSDNRLTRFRRFFLCAAQLALSRARPHHRHVIFYLSSDYEPLRTLVDTNLDAILPASAWTHPTLPRPLGLVHGGAPHHIDLAHHPGAATGYEWQQEEREEEKELHRAQLRQLWLQTTILDSYVMDAADYRILSTYSGFGQLSALRSWDRHGATSLMMDRVGTGYDEAPPMTAWDGLKCDNPEAMMFYEEAVGQWGFG